MARLIVLLLMVLPGFVTNVRAQTVPTKTIAIYNNSAARTIYPVIQAPIINGPGGTVHDLWMQALFNVKDVKTQIFNTTLLYKVYINPNGGIPPHGSVNITVPFYTQLLPATDADLGMVNDQFVDWWNAMRIFIFDGKDALDAAFNYSVDANGNVVPPISVTSVAGATVPTCAAIETECEPLHIKAYVNGFPISVPAQLVEYTFAAAQGPPLNPVLSIALDIVNYNISAVDSVYLPAAIGARGNASAANTYLGSVERVTSFRAALASFATGGALWPDYVPAYFTAAQPIVPLAVPPPPVKAYPQPQIPSTNTVYAESFRNPPPAPPVLTSDTLSGIGKLGDTAQGTFDLWDKCTGSVANNSTTCQNIRAVSEFFLADYHACFGAAAPLPDKNDFLRDVYGWVQFPGCSTALSAVPGYAATIVKYCDLQYNFFDTSVPAEDIFNPYVALIHRTLKSNAYAFSIDDAVSFKSLPGTGIIVTVAGTQGLENITQTPLPAAATYKSYCRTN